MALEQRLRNPAIADEEIHNFLSLHSADGELRVLATRLLPSPLSAEALSAFLRSVSECALLYPSNSTEDKMTRTTVVEADEAPPDDSSSQLTREVFLKCPSLKNSTEKYVAELKRTTWPFQVGRCARRCVLVSLGC